MPPSVLCHHEAQCRFPDALKTVFLRRGCFMNCLVCHADFPGWRSACPKCQILLLPNQGETISESEPEVPENERTRSGLMTILRVAVLVIALIGLATMVRLNYVSGGREKEAQAKAGIRTSSPPRGPVSAENRPGEKLVSGKAEEASDQSANPGKDELSDKKSRSLSTRTRRAEESPKSATKGEADRIASAEKPEPGNADTASPGKAPESAAASATSSVAQKPNCRRLRHLRRPKPELRSVLSRWIKRSV
jgi:hypothetical protein